MNGRDRAAGWWAVLLLAAITGLGFWLRWAYVRDVSFFVDEYLTVRAAQRILDLGMPLLPSGNFYSHGLLLSYVVAAIVGLGGQAPWLVRLPVLLASTASIPATYWFGRRLFGRSRAGSQAAGLIAAALLAFAPEAILWGGRVRMYGALQLTVLLATAVFYLWVVQEEDRPVYRVSFVLAYWASVFLHAEAMLLLPLWGLWALLQRGWRWCLRPANLTTFGLSGGAVAVEIVLRRLGPAVQAWVSPGVLEPLTRQYLGAALDWPGVQKVVDPLFLTTQRLPCTILALGGLGYVLIAWFAPRFRKPEVWQALATLYALLVPVLGLLLFVVDPSWKSPRYGLMLLPHFFLIVGGVVASGTSLLVRGLGWRPRAGRATAWAGITTAAAVAVVAGAFWSPAVAATRESVPSYDWAFAYVEDQQQAGDAIITFLCPAAFVHLGRCDYLAIPSDFSGFATKKEGRWVSGWDEVPLLDSAEGLRQVLAEAPGAWFVVDEGRLTQRYPADLVQAVWDGMELVAAEREMLVFRSVDRSEKEANQERHADLADGLSLLGYALSAEELAPGRELTLVLRWQARSWVAGDYAVFVHLLDEQGRLRGQTDGPPLGGLYPTWRWPPGLALPDHHTMSLAEDLEAGRYRLEAGLYDAASTERLAVLGGAGSSVVLDYVWIGERPPAAVPQHRLEATFGGAIRLLGYDLWPEQPAALAPGAALTVTLYWQAVSEVAGDYTVFVHLVDAAGEIQAQGDGPPLEGRYPTSFWDRGELLRDAHPLTAGPGTVAGEYRLLVGLYTLEDGLRLTVTDGTAAGDDSVEIVLPLPEGQ
jgi:hypothetical protein